MYLNFHFSLGPVVDHYKKMITLAEALSYQGIYGHCRPNGRMVQGSITCLPREKERIFRKFQEIFDKQPSLRQVQHIDYAQGDKLPPRFMLINEPDKESPWLRSDFIHLNKIDHRGTLHGWVFNPESPFERLQLDVYVDDQYLSRVTANTFSLDLLISGVGDGGHAFVFQCPDHFLDGKRHGIRIVYKRDNSEILAVSFRKNLTFPRLFEVLKPWRAQTSLSKFNKLKNRVMLNGIKPNLPAVEEILEKHPELVFADFGLLEWYQRHGKRFLSFRERLAARLQDPKLLPLIRNFNSKTFTKSYCEENHILCAQTLLVTNEIGVMKAFDFPDQFVLKPTSGSGQCTFIYDGGVNFSPRKSISIEEILNSVTSYMEANPGVEFVVEEFLGQRASDGPIVPVDYKFHVFGGKTRIIHVNDNNIFKSRDHLYRQQGWFSKDWKPSPMRIRIKEEESVDFRKPTSLADMIELVEKIGRVCQDYIRVDLYDTENGIALGEVTVFSHGGKGFTEFGNFVLSQAWEISKVNMV